MKLINKIKVYGKMLLVSSCLTLVSCDFLDIVPPEQATLNDATKNADLTLNFLYSCYASVWNPLTPNATDEHAWPASWGGPHRYVSYGLCSPANVYDNGRWTDFYKSINQTNLFLREVEKAQGCTPQQIEEWKAEANFLLAYYHYELLAYYGPIPINDHYMDTNTAESDFSGRMHYDYVVNWIVDLLDKKVISSPSLPATRPSEDRGRATSVIAKALKARVLLYAASPLWNGEFPYMSWTNKVETPGYGTELISKTKDNGKWERAKAACEDALTTAKEFGYKLYDDISYVTETQKIKQELLPFIPGLQNPDSEAGQEFRKRVLMLRNMITLKVNEGNTELVWGLAKDAGIVGYVMPRHIIKNNNGSWFNGYQAISPTLNTVLRFYTQNGYIPKHDAENGFPAESEWFQRAGLTGTRADIIKLNTLREPRFYAWLAFDGGDYGTMISAGHPLLLKLRSESDQGYNPAEGGSNTGFLNQKWIRVDQSRSSNGSWSNNAVNRFARPMIRMAELYLNLAECKAALGDKDALSELNEVRRRAGIKALEESDLSKMSLMDWVRNERFVELWGEGHRWNDVRRWCLGAEYFGEGKREGLDAFQKNPSFEAFNTRVKIDQPYCWYNRMYLAPIIYNETQKNKKLIQAPGY